MSTRRLRFAAYGSGALVPELVCLVRAACTPATQRLLALTCRREHAALPPAPRDALLVLLVREGAFRLLRRCTDDRFFRQHAVLVHTDLVHAAIDGRQWRVLRWLFGHAALPSHVPGQCCVNRIVTEQCPDKALVLQVMHRATRSGVHSREYLESMAVSAAVRGNDVAMLDRLVQWKAVRITDGRRLLRSESSFDIQNPRRPLTPWLARVDALRWLEGHGGSVDAVTWMGLVKDMVYQQWSPTDIDRFCRAGLGNTTLFDACCVPPVPGIYDDTVVTPSVLRRWATAAGNEAVFAWASHLL